MFNALLFLWIQSQTFYKQLQEDSLSSINEAKENETWADIGCSTGLLSRLAHKRNYNVTGYDINYFSLVFARILSMNKINYQKKDLYEIDTKYDRVSATSLLSVVEDKNKALNKLVSLLKNDNSHLIIIEPTEKLSLLNTKKLIYNLKTFWFYKGLLLWAKARQNKAVDTQIFEDLKGFKVSTKYYLQGMVSVSVIIYLPS